MSRPGIASETSGEGIALGLPRRDGVFGMAISRGPPALEQGISNPVGTYGRNIEYWTTAENRFDFFEFQGKVICIPSCAVWRAVYSRAIAAHWALKSRAVRQHSRII
jgi:hypothetical protein